MGEQVLRLPCRTSKNYHESFGDIENYFVFVQCRVIPPRNLYLPVLTYYAERKVCSPCVGLPPFFSVSLPVRTQTTGELLSEFGYRRKSSWRKRKDTASHIVPFPGIFYFPVPIIH